MKTKVGASLIAALMMMGLFGAATASAKPGPETGNSEKGLCTAYFNGQKKGHDRNGQPGPFADLQERAEEDAPRNNDSDDENDVTGYEAVFNYCDSLFTIGGNPEHGRYNCTADDPATEGDEFGCTERDDPNTGKGKPA